MFTWPKLKVELGVLTCTSLNTNGMVRLWVGRRLLSLKVCGTLVRDANGWWPNSSHSNIVNMSRSHRRMVQTSPRSGRPRTRHTSGRPGRMALLQPKINRDLYLFTMFNMYDKMDITINHKHLKCKFQFKAVILSNIASSSSYAERNLEYRHRRD